MPDHLTALTIAMTADINKLADEAVEALSEAYRFASTPPRAQENIILALGNIEQLRAAALGAVPAAGEHSPEFQRLYRAINNLLCHIGIEGEVNSKHGFVDEAMDALAAIDGGAYQTNIAPQYEAAEPAGEVVIGPAGDVEGWTVVKWGEKGCPPVGTKLYTRLAAPPAPSAKEAGPEVTQPTWGDGTDRQTLLNKLQDGEPLTTDQRSALWSRLAAAPPVDEAAERARFEAEYLRRLGDAPEFTKHARLRRDPGSDAYNQYPTECQWQGFCAGWRLARAEGGGAHAIVRAEPWLKADEVRDRLERGG